MQLGREHLIPLACATAPKHVALLANWHTPQCCGHFLAGFDHRVLLCLTGTEWAEPSAMMYAETFKWVLEDRPYVGCECRLSLSLSPALAN